MILLSSYRQFCVFAALSFIAFGQPARIESDEEPTTGTLLASVRNNRPTVCTEPLKAWITTRDGDQLEGELVTEVLSFTIGAETQQIKPSEVLSFHSAEAASTEESERITNGLAALAGTDIQACESAAADLTDIGLPVMSPLLKSYQDTDAHEPDYRYRLFGRIVPGRADDNNRSLDLIRLVGGDLLRGKLATTELKIAGADGKQMTVPSNDVRRLAIQQDSISKTFDLQALHHCTYVGFFDTGIVATERSSLREDCVGYVRLSFDEDGWAADPDGIKEPLQGKRKLQEGFRWGALLGRVGPTGQRWFAGKHVEKTELGQGRLYFVINDNEHWQNNIGSYRVECSVTNAYDVGEPQ